MTKQQAYLASTLCVSFALIFSYPLAQFAPTLMAVIYGSALIGIGSVFFLIGINK